MNKNKKGFTVIEILIIVCIIIILVTVVLISLISAREKARDNSAFTSFKSLAAPAFMCLSSSAGTQLINPPPASSYSIVNICSNTGITPDSTWPDLTRSGWDTFSWCNLNSSGATEPASCPSYAGGSCGGTGGSGDFCFKLTKDSKSMWCTIDGCRKSGF